MVVAKSPHSARNFVLVIGPLPPPINGAAMATHDIASALRTHGHVRTYNIAPDNQNSGGFAKLIKPIRVGLALCGMLAFAWKRNKSLYLALDGGSGLIYDILIAAIARVSRYQLTMHHHSYSYINQPSQLMQLLTTVAGSKATHVVLCSDMATKFKNVYPLAEKTYILSGSAFVSPFTEQRKPRSEDLRIGQLSNLDVDKGLDTLIEIFRTLRRQNLPVRLILAGRPFNEHANELLLSAKSEFGTSFEYLGAVSESDKHHYFQNLDVFIFPTRYVNEAQPRVVFEAFAHGVPVITVSRSCIPSDVGDAGICISADLDFKEMTITQIKQWICHPQKLDAMSLCAITRSKILHEQGRHQLNLMVTDIARFTEAQKN